MARNVLRCWLASLLLGPACALALEVGEIQVDSALNQLFDATIPLPMLSPEELGRISVKVASPTMFKEFGLDRGATLDNLVFSIQYDAEGKVYVKVVSIKPIHEPSLALLLEFGWPRGKTFREFTVLLDPVQRLVERPAGRTKTVLDAPADTGVESSSEPPSADIVVNRTIQYPDQSGSSTEALSSAESWVYRPGDVYGPVTPGEGLWGIALKIRPDPGITRDQMMQALFQANPDAFTKAGVDGLRIGALLRIPTFQEIADFTGSAVAKQLAAAEQMATEQATASGAGTGIASTAKAPASAAEPMASAGTNTSNLAVFPLVQPGELEPSPPASEPAAVVAEPKPEAPEPAVVEIAKPDIPTPEPAAVAAEPKSEVPTPEPAVVAEPKPEIAEPVVVAVAEPKPEIAEPVVVAVVESESKVPTPEPIAVAVAEPEPEIAEPAVVAVAESEPEAPTPEPAVVAVAEPKPEIPTPEPAAVAVEPKSEASAPAVVEVAKAEASTLEPAVAAEPKSEASEPAVVAVAEPKPEVPTPEPVVAAEPESALNAAASEPEKPIIIGPVSATPLLFLVVSEVMASATAQIPHAPISSQTPSGARIVDAVTSEPVLKPDVDAALPEPGRQTVLEQPGTAFQATHDTPTAAAANVSESSPAADFAESPVVDSTIPPVVVESSEVAQVADSTESPAGETAEATQVVDSAESPAGETAALAEVAEVVEPVDSTRVEPAKPAEPVYKGGEQYGPVAPNERLWDIAAKVRPAPDIGIDAMIKALFAINPTAFSKAGVDYLKVGVTLRVPTLREIVDHTGSKVAKQLLEQQAVANKAAGPADSVQEPSLPPPAAVSGSDADPEPKPSSPPSAIN